MSPLSWSFPRLALFWLVSAFVGGICWRIGQLLSPLPERFFFLIPYDGASESTVRAIFAVCREFLLQRPWQATAVIAVPVVVLVVTISWGATRLSR